MTPKQMAAIENEHMRLNLQPNSVINGRGYKGKVDLRAVVFDVLRTREAWTVSDLAKRMRLKEGAAHQMLKETATLRAELFIMSSSLSIRKYDKVEF